jgi:hypothetical protein
MTRDESVDDWLSERPDDKRLQDHERVTVADTNSVSLREAVCVAHNSISGSAEPNHATATGTSIAAETEETTFLNTLTFESVTLLLAASRGASAVSFVHRMRGRRMEKELHWYRPLPVIPIVVDRAFPPIMRPTHVPAHTSLEPSKIRMAVTFGLESAEMPISG